MWSRNFCIENGKKNILLEVSSIVIYVFYPPVWQFVDAMLKKLWFFFEHSSLRFIFVHFRQKSCAAQQRRVSSTQTSRNRMDSSLMHKPRRLAFPPQFSASNVSRSCFAVRMDRQISYKKSLRAACLYSDRFFLNSEPLTLISYY